MPRPRHVTSQTQCLPGSLGFVVSFVLFDSRQHGLCELQHAAQEWQNAGREAVEKKARLEAERKVPPSPSRYFTGHVVDYDHYERRGTQQKQIGCN